MVPIPCPQAEHPWGRAGTLSGKKPHSVQLHGCLAAAILTNFTASLAVPGCLGCAVWPAQQDCGGCSGPD